MNKEWKSITMTILVVVGAFGLVAMLATVMPMTFEGDRVTYEYREGNLVGWNRTRGVFYIEMANYIKTIDVDDEAFDYYNIGDRFGWREKVIHHGSGMTNLTRTDP
jgi:hypothetical protein